MFQGALRSRSWADIACLSRSTKVRSCAQVSSRSLAGNNLAYRSALVLPDAHVGYQYLLSRKALAEAAYTTGFVLTGRSDAAGDSRDLDLARRARRARRAPRRSHLAHRALDAHARRRTRRAPSSGSKDRSAPSPERRFRLRVRARWDHADAITTRKSVSRSARNKSGGSTPPASIESRAEAVAALVAGVQVADDDVDDPLARRASSALRPAGPPLAQPLDGDAGEVRASRRPRIEREVARRRRAPCRRAGLPAVVERAALEEAVVADVVRGAVGRACARAGLAARAGSSVSGREDGVERDLAARRRPSRKTPKVRAYRSTSSKPARVVARRSPGRWRRPPTGYGERWTRRPKRSRRARATTGSSLAPPTT